MNRSNHNIAIMGILLVVLLLLAAVRSASASETGSCTGIPREGSGSNYIESTFFKGDVRYTVNNGHAVAQRFKPDTRCISKISIRGIGFDRDMLFEIRKDHCGDISASGCVPSGLPGNPSGRIDSRLVSASQIPQSGEETFDIDLDPPIVLPDTTSYYHLMFGPASFAFGSNSGAVITLAKKDVYVAPDIHTSVTVQGTNSKWYNLNDVLVFGIFYQDYNATPSDTTPPASITNLANTSYATTYINWTWTDPNDSDFAGVSVWLNGTFKTNVSKGMQYYNATNLNHGTTYIISIRTRDESGNMNQTWVNDTEETMPDIGCTGKPSINSERLLKFSLEHLRNIGGVSDIVAQRVIPSSTCLQSITVQPVRVSPGKTDWIVEVRKDDSGLPDYNVAPYASLIIPDSTLSANSGGQLNIVLNAKLPSMDPVFICFSNYETNVIGSYDIRMFGYGTEIPDYYAYYKKPSGWKKNLRNAIYYILYKI